MGAHVLELVLAVPADQVQPGPPAPWQRDALTGRWQLRREDYTPDDADQRRERRLQCAPYPTLVSVGYSDEGDYWLLDLEQVAALTLVGDRDRCLDLARFAAAELAHNVWSEQMEVMLVGFGAEVADINPDRVTHFHDAGRALSRLQAQLRSNREVLADFGLADALQGRQEDVAADQWMPQVLLIDSEALDEQAAGQLHAVLSALRGQNGSTAVAVVIISGSPAGEEPAGRNEWRLQVDSDGHLHLPALRLTLNAQQLPAHEAGQLARFLAASASLQDRAMPAAHGQAAWEGLSDAAGAPIEELTTPRSEANADAAAAVAPTRPAPTVAAAARIRLAPAHTAAADPAAVGTDPGSELASLGGPDVPAPTPPISATIRTAPPLTDDERRAPEAAASVLEQAMATVLETAATTERDVQVLAPSMTGTACRQIEDADAGLDVDLAAWHAADTARPRLSLLGAVQVRASGSLPDRSPRVAWHTEVVAYLAAHPRGVTAEQFGTDLWPRDPDILSKTKLRQSVHLVRTWLAKDPETRRPYLPTATTPGGGGVGLYRIEGLLSDAELFRRLRLRGVARAGEGISDLETALRLVAGPPFDQRRVGGYTWLADVPLDHEYTAMIVDVAHLVATHHLASGRPDLATAAAKVSLMAGSHDDVALLDLVAASDAQGNRGEAGVWIRKILANHDAEVEEDLPPRTAEILHRRRWTHRAS
jgi:hypothetical protein